MWKMFRIRKMLSLFRKYHPNTTNEWLVNNDQRLPKRWNHFVFDAVLQGNFLKEWYEFDTSNDLGKKTATADRYMRHAINIGLVSSPNRNLNNTQMDLCITDEGIEYVTDWTYFLQKSLSQFNMFTTLLIGLSPLMAIVLFTYIPEIIYRLINNF